MVGRRGSQDRHRSPKQRRRRSPPGRLVPTREKRINVVKLRLMRMGKKKQPTYRVVAADARSPRNGRFIEIVGTYQPRQEPSVVLIDNAKAVAWLNKGAQPTETVEKLLKISGAWDEFKGTAPATPAPAAEAEAS